MELNQVISVAKTKLALEDIRLFREMTTISQHILLLKTKPFINRHEIKAMEKRFENVEKDYIKVIERYHVLFVLMSYMKHDLDPAKTIECLLDINFEF